MKNPIRKFYEFLDTPLKGGGRIVVALLVIPLILAFTEPLWNIRLEAPQYPGGLTLDIYLHKLEGGNGGQHIDEINVLNHYIGMRPITREELADLDWLPFAIGILVLLTLRVAAIGTVKSLLDLTVLVSYFSLFSLGRFAYQLYSFGHELNPRAPITVEPFMPPLFGSQKIANFWSHSFPQWGSVFLGTFATGLALVLVWHLISGRRAAQRAESAEGPPPDAGAQPA
jgi:copper chaperone NosL